MVNSVCTEVILYKQAVIGGKVLDGPLPHTPGFVLPISRDEKGTEEINARKIMDVLETWPPG
jgi:hypothetical protein